MAHHGDSGLSSPALDSKKHLLYFKRCLGLLPSLYASTEASRMVLVQFCLGGIDLYGEIDACFSPDEKQSIIRWIYDQQVVPNGEGTNILHCGFKGGPFMTIRKTDDTVYEYSNCANLAATYSALACLAILGDDFSRVNRDAIIGALKHLQMPNGSFVPHLGTKECDMRFLYSACIVSYLLNDWRGVDIERATEYILMCTRYDGGITQEPMQESHGGSYFCALASLALMDKLDALEDRRMTLEWGLRRQVGGFQGRVNKPADVCYSFWVGSGIEILGGHQFVDLEEAARFVLECQHAIGGLGKFKGSLPDPLHSYLGLVGLSYTGKFPQLCKVVPELNMTIHTLDILKRNSVFWRPVRDRGGSST